MHADSGSDRAGARPRLTERVRGTRAASRDVPRAPTRRGGPTSRTPGRPEERGLREGGRQTCERGGAPGDGCIGGGAADLEHSTARLRCRASQAGAAARARALAVLGLCCALAHPGPRPPVPRPLSARTVLSQQSPPPLLCPLAGVPAGVAVHPTPSWSPSLSAGQKIDTMAR